MQNNSHKTAIARSAPSIPAQYAINILRPQLGFNSILDWGCGRGRDLAYYKKQLGARLCDGYDPYYLPKIPIGRFDFATCSYVLNVMNLDERKTVLQSIKNKLVDGGHVLIAMRPIKEIERNSHSWRKHEDGYITSRGTFQSAVLTAEMVSLIEETGFKIINVIDNSKTLMILAQK
jgi:hypothetical protein